MDIVESLIESIKNKMVGDGCMQVIRVGTHKDVEKVKSFLTKVGISTEGVERIIEYFVVIEDIDGGLIATLGIEPLDNIGILRSMVIHPSIKEEDLFTIFQHVYNLASNKKLSTLYLTTNKEKSLPLFRMAGFERIEKTHLPKEFEHSLYGKHLLSHQQAIFMEKVM
ncbi:GNAT family N-acetyltransferase [Heyndrickxia vini]|uniref:N-acetyltransferase domain-containing protein n=1 Tax=Heyndrickxia vini TaxID=1476025 RepID=A0ABX7E1N8_9BACI|nr:hypothetical protein [Heyndrickxia vini]QQZ09223.1 hypothetical protein I5776_20020 [Heyndrickxia vini]